MGFFDPSVSSDDPGSSRGPRSRWPSVPDDVLPASLAFDALIGARSSLALYLTRLCAYPDALLFDLWVIDVAKTGRLPPALGPDLVWPEPHPHGRFPEAALRLGVAFADGRRGTNLHISPEISEGSSSPPILMWQGARTLGRIYVIQWLLSPLPSDGDLTVVAEWPAHEFAEQQVVVPGAALRDAASRAHRLT
jgi:hypothetical protein